MNILARLKEIESRKIEIRKLLNEGADLNLEELGTELESLEAETKTLNQRKKMAEEINSGAIPASSFPASVAKEDADEEKNYRSAFFKHLQGKPLSDTEKRAFDSSSVVGAMPTDTVNAILAKLKQIVPMLDQITLFNFPGAVKFAVEGARLPAALHDENASISASDDTLATVELGAHEIVKIIKVSETVKAMTIPAFESWLVNNLTETIAENIDNYIINGTGVSQPKGIAAAATWEDGTNAVAWASPTALANADITEAISLLPGRYDKNAKFFMSKKTLWGNVMPIRDDGKAPIVRGENGKHYIYGYEVCCDDNVANGVIYFGDARKIYGNLGENINVKSSPDAGFETASIVYRGLAIFDCKPAFDDAFVKIASSLA